MTASTAGPAFAELNVTSVRDRALRAFTKGVGKSIDDVIIGGLPDGYDLTEVTNERHFGAKFSVFSYRGEPFLELHDMEFSTNDDGLKITAAGRFRYLKAPA